MVTMRPADGFDEHMHEETNQRIPATSEASDRRGSVRFLLSPSVLGTNLAVALVVGVILSVANQVDALLRGGWTAALQLKILFNFLVPFTVASASTALHRRRQCPRPSGKQAGSRGNAGAP